MIVEPIFLTNISITLVSIWIALYINAQFIRPAIMNKKRFALFSLRDRLLLLAMTGEIQEHSEEYLTLIKLINSTLSSTKNFRITRFIKVHTEIAKDQELKTHLESIAKKIQNYSMPGDYKRIVAEYFSIALNLHKSHTKTLRIILLPMILMVKFLTRFLSSTVKALNYLQYQQKRVKDIDSNFSDNLDTFVH